MRCDQTPAPTPAPTALLTPAPTICTKDDRPAGCVSDDLCACRGATGFYFDSYWDTHNYGSVGQAGCIGNNVDVSGREVRCDQTPAPTSAPTAGTPTPPPLHLGVLALKGDSDVVSLGVCIASDSEAVAAPDGKLISAQCCTSGGACKRRTTNSNNNCIAGVYGQSSFVEMTFAQTQASCSSRGLVLCEKSCSGQGCMYNSGYVWTGLTCADR